MRPSQIVIFLWKSHDRFLLFAFFCWRLSSFLLWIRLLWRILVAFLFITFLLLLWFWLSPGHDIRNTYQGFVLCVLRNFKSWNGRFCFIKITCVKIVNYDIRVKKNIVKELHFISLNDFSDSLWSEIIFLLKPLFLCD